MQARRDAVSIRSPLPIDNCTSVLREALAQSDLEVASELDVRRQVRRKLGLQLRKYTIFTVWDPVQVYQAIRADALPSTFATFDIAVVEDGPGSIVAAPTESLLGADAASAATRFMGHSLWEKTEKILAQVKAARLTTRKSDASFHFAGWLRREALNVLRLVTGGAR